MKTNRLLTLIPLFTLFLFVSCNKEAVDSVESQSGSPVTLSDDEANVLFWSSRDSKTLNYEEATKSVEYLIDILSKQSRSANKRTILNSQVLSSDAVNPSSRSQAITDTAVYLFNFTNEEGFALISGDVRTDRVLCFVENGNLYPEEVVDNPGFALFLAFAEKSLQKQKQRADSLTTILLPTALEKAQIMDEKEYFPENHIESRAQPTYYYEPTSNGVWPLLTTEWDQGYPFNALAPVANAPAGCVAVAAGQIMAYWEKPADRPWDDIKSGKQPTTQAGHQAVAQLMLDIGRGVNMDYKIDGSGAKSENVPPYLRSVGLNSGNLSSYNSLQLYDNKVREQLNQSRPVYMSGYSKKTQKKFLGIVISTSYQEGHAWVCDGYREFEIFDRSYRGVVVRSDGTVYVDRSVYTGPIIKENLLHMNWGWGSNNGANGYYSASCFDTNAGPLTRGQESYYYQYKLEYIPNIY